MFWDRVAKVYDLFENAYNGKVNREFSSSVANMIEGHDYVLECACGTGLISQKIAVRCNELVATDFSTQMLNEAKKKCKPLENIRFERGNILDLKFDDETFDKVVAGNIIHLLDEPKIALKELERVCKKGGKIIIPTYLTCKDNGKTSLLIRLFKKAGGNFKREFSFEKYKEFFTEMGYENVEYKLVNGRMASAIAIITK